MANPSEVRVSSRGTFGMKVVWPMVWLGGMTYFSYHGLTGSPVVRWGPGVSPFWGNVIVFVFLLLGLVVTATFCLPLKNVWLTAEGLRAAGYLSQATIRWSEVSRLVVRGSFSGRSSPVVDVHLGTEPSIGRRFSLLAASEPRLNELLERAASFQVKIEGDAPSR